MTDQFPDLDQSIRELPPAELKSRLDDGEKLTLLDTRRPDDFEEWHISHENLSVVNVPFTAFLDGDEQEPADEVPDDVPSGPLVTCCAKGISSHYVAEFLAREGWDVASLEDGMEGWAHLYEEHPLSVSETDVSVVQLHRPSSGCLSYLFVADGEAAVVDPLRAFTTRYQALADSYNATIEYAIDTHIHADHVSGVRELGETTDATVVLPAGATARGLEFEAQLIEDGESLELGEREITALALPGHTTEMMGYRFAGVLAGGDTVFLDGVARPDLEDADAARAAAETLWETVQDMTELPDDLVIGPGHLGPTTVPRDDGTFTESLGDLRSRLRAFEESQSEFVERATANLPPQPSNYEEIIAVNLGRAGASSEEAFELELGPNNCGVAE